MTSMHVSMCWEELESLRSERNEKVLSMRNKVITVEHELKGAFESPLYIGCSSEVEV